MTETRKKGLVKGMKSEYKKISWPRRQDIINMTLVVLATIVGVSIVVKLIDLIFQFVLSFTL